MIESAPRKLRCIRREFHKFSQGHARTLREEAIGKEGDWKGRRGKEREMGEGGRWSRKRQKTGSSTCWPHQ